MAFTRVSTNDVRPDKIVQKFNNEIANLKNKFSNTTPPVQNFTVYTVDEKVESLDYTLPKPIKAEPIADIGVFSEPDGGGTKYREEPDANGLINNSLVCYLFDEQDIATRNLDTFAGAVLKSEPPVVPTSGVLKWEVSAANIEANKIDLNTQRQRTVFDPPFPSLGNTVTTRIYPPLPDPVTSIGTTTTNPTPGQTTIDATGSAFNTTLKVNYIVRIGEDPTGYLVTAVNSDTQFTIAPPITLPQIGTQSIYRFPYSDVDVPAPQPPTIKNLLTQIPFSVTNTINLIEQNIVIPVSTPITTFKDKTGNYDATILGVPPSPTPLLGTSPFGPNKGRYFTPASTGIVQVTPLFEGQQSAEALKQGPECGISAVFKLDPSTLTTGCTLASCSSPPIGTGNPFAGTKYSLQLVTLPSGGPFLFPRLAWTFYDVSAGGVMRTAYAQSYTPIPMPANLTEGYLPSNPVISASTFFVGAFRYTKELNLTTVPSTPSPYDPRVVLDLNWDNPDALFNNITYGDWITFGNDQPAYGTTSYQVAYPYGSTTSPTGTPVIPQTTSVLNIPYLGNPPSLLPFPKGKKLFSVGVSFYIGDVNSGNFFIDDFVTYGTDAIGSVVTLPVLNNNMPFPAPGELCNFFIGSDPYSVNRLPCLGHGNGVAAATSAALGGLDIYGVIASGIAASAIPVGTGAFASPSFCGDFYALNIPASIPAAKHDRDKIMTDYFNSCFADYKITGPTIRRTPRSGIPNHGTVYLNYQKSSSLQEIEDFSKLLKELVNSILVGANNPAVNNVDSLATAIGVDLPVTGDALAAQLEPQGLHVVNGRPYLPGDTPVASFKKLVDTIGYDNAVDVCVGRTEGTGSVQAGDASTYGPLLVISISERSEGPAYDSCGNSFTKVTVTERVLGINISTDEALRIAGIEDPDLLILRMFWVGGIPPITEGINNKLNSFNLHPEDKTAALLGEGNGTIEVYEIPEPDVVTQLNGSADEIKKLFEERNPVSLNVSPTNTEMKDALTRVALLPAAATLDGSSNPVPPYMALFESVDMSKAFNITQSDLDDVDKKLSKELDDVCMALFQGSKTSLLNAGKCLDEFKISLAPSLKVINFNLGMTQKTLSTYIPCVGSFTASMAVPPSPKEVFDALRTMINEFPFPRSFPNPNAVLDSIRDAILNPIPPDELKDLMDRLKEAISHLPNKDQLLLKFNELRDALSRPPSPQEVVDRAWQEVPSLTSIAGQLSKVKDLLGALIAMMPVLSSTVDTVVDAATQSLCVPQGIADAYRGGSCSVAVPPGPVTVNTDGVAVVGTAANCVSDSTEFLAHLDVIDNFVLAAQTMLDVARISFAQLSDSLNASLTQTVTLQFQADGCLQAVSDFIKSASNIKIGEKV